MKIALLSSWNENYASLAALTLPNKQSYCDRHGYTHYKVLTPLDWPYLAVWARLDAIIDTLPKCELLATSGVDAIFTNPTIKIEDLLSGEDFACGSDINGLNNDFMILRNTPWMNNFLIRWQESRNRMATYTNADQTALAMLLHTEPHEKFACLSQKVCNSYRHSLYQPMSNPDGEWEPGDFIFHAPALSLDKRIALLTEILNGISYSYQ